MVGNGPLDDVQRSNIASFDTVLRFNRLNNRCCHLSHTYHTCCSRADPSHQTVASKKA